MFSWFIARRYLVSKKSVHIINLISVISVFGVALGTMALIVVLSAMNGINGFIETMLLSFDSDLKITAADAKSFSPDEADLSEVTRLTGIAGHAWVVEETALLEYNGRQRTATVKGVETGYDSFTGIDSVMTYGQFVLRHEGLDYAVFGAGVAYDLSLSFVDQGPVYVYYPKKTQKGRLAVQNTFNRLAILPSGRFSVQQEIDTRYVLVPLAFAQALFETGTKVTSLELKLNRNVQPAEIKNRIKALLGDRFDVKDRYERNEFLYKVMRSEKWSGFLILGFILVVASFNLLGSLTMIMIDKKNDIFILESMGANRRLIRRIFLLEGWLISLSGAIMGTVLGIWLVWLQKKFELLKLSSEGSFAISAYPVELQFPDVLLVVAFVLLIGFLAAWYPTMALRKSEKTTH